MPLLNGIELNHVKLGQRIPFPTINANRLPKGVKTCLVILFIMICLSFSQSVWAVDIKLAWNPNSEPDLAGYKIYYGTSSRNYGPPINVGNITTYTMTNLDPKNTYYFAVTAYDTLGNESGFSNEIRWPNLDLIDFSQDGKSDLLWYNESTGYAGIWTMNGTSVSSVAVPGGTVDPNWKIHRAGDVNDDGTTDILWHHATTGHVAIWLMSGVTVFSIGVPGAAPIEWQIKGMGDFDGNGKSDILWQHSTTGTMAIWFMNGASISSIGVPGAISSEWQIKGIGDFDGNGKSDILWQHSTTRTVAIWFMNGTNISSTGVVGSVQSGWELINLGDFNSDGKSDIVWQYYNPQQQLRTIAIWIMDGVSVTSQGVAGATSSDWQLVR